MTSAWAPFLGVAVVVIVTPGPDTALTIRNALLGGRRGGVFTAIGVSSGQALWTLATSLGLAAILRSSEPAFVALKFAGGAYLAVLGAQALLAAIRGTGGGRVSLGGDARRLNPLAAFRQGLLSNLTNPKMAVFFPSLLPQFTSHGDASFSALLALGLVFCTLTLVWLATYAVVVAKAGDFLSKTSIRRSLEGVTGVVLVGLGLRLASEHR
jgi:threonine/homoserine/homoserine lactone efflux protein